MSIRTIAFTAVLLFASAANAADSNTFEIESEGDDLTKVERLLEKLKEAQDGGGDLHVGDLLDIVKVESGSEAIISDAYPTPLAITCELPVCQGSGSGAAARAPLAPTQPEFAGVSIGVRSTLKAKFILDPSGTKALICEVEGVYFSRLIARKNLKAFHIELNPDSAKIKVWLAGATEVPACVESVTVGGAP